MNIDRKALLWGTGVFIALYVLHLLLLPLLVGTEQGGKASDSTLYGIHQFLGLATCLVSGFVAARVAGRNGFLHGFVVGSLGTVVTALAAVLWSLVAGAKFPVLGTLPFWLVVNGFLGAFAGLVASNLKEDEGGF
jgi:fructose-specific phosphotransferase system IIC component